MTIGRCRQPELAQQDLLPRRIGEMILATQDMRHPHEAVIKGIGKQKSRCAIGPLNHRVTQGIGRDGLLSTHQVVKLEHPGLRHPQPQHRRLARCATVIGLVTRQRSTTTIVARGLTLTGLLRPELGQPLLTAKAPIGRIRRQQFIRRAGINFGTSRLLPVLRRSDTRPFIPIQAQPAQIRGNGIESTGVIACQIAVLDAEQKMPSVTACQQDVEKRGTQITQMQFAGGTGSEAGFHGV